MGKLKHEKRRDYKCSMCDYAAGRRQGLSYHTKMVHEKIKDINCQHCDSKFSLNEDLTRHVKVVHNKIKEYECNKCGYEFGTNSELKRHIGSKHKKDEPPPENIQENVQDKGDDVTETTCQMCGFKSSKIS